MKSPAPTLRSTMLSILAALSITTFFLTPVTGQKPKAVTADDIHLPFEGLSLRENGPIFTVINEADTRTAKGIRAAADGVGVFGESTGDDGMGVLGAARGPASSGVKGQSDGGRGVDGFGTPGVYGQSMTPAGHGVHGYNRDKKAYGFIGGPLHGVQGVAEAGNGHGVAGKSESGPNGAAIYGQSSKAYAGFFNGKVMVNGDFIVKKILAEEVYSAKGLIGQGGAKFFKIDHPLDPANKFLWHASVESSELKNMYDGIATLDAKGTAWVTLPDWFQALNKDYRYQLTCVGGSAAVFIAEEIKDNRFQIGGGTPGLRVSWQVTGVRQDAWGRAHPLQVEEDKRGSERGKYLSPEENGLPIAMGINHRKDSVTRIDDPGSRRQQ